MIILSLGFCLSLLGRMEYASGFYLCSLCSVCIHNMILYPVDATRELPFDFAVFGHDLAFRLPPSPLQLRDRCFRLPHDS